MFYFFCLLSVALAQPNGYPALDVLPPANAAWTEAVNHVSAPSAQVFTTCPKGQWALTFDDGPAPPTPQVLALLKKYNIKATFFVVGSRVISRSSILKQAYDDGHEIALHSWSHVDYASSPIDQVIADLIYNIKAVHQVIGVYPRYFRPPFGYYNKQVLDVLGKFGLDVVLFDRDTEDWQVGTSLTITQILQNVNQWAQNTSSGGISLQHDLYEQAVSIADQILAPIVKSSYKIVTVSDCIGQSAYVQSDLASTILGLAPSTVANTTLTASSSSTASTSTPTVNTVGNQVKVTSSALKINPLFYLSMLLLVSSC